MQLNTLLNQIYSILEANKKLLVFTPFFLLWGILFTLTSIPSDSMPIELGIHDKIEHLIAYFAFSGMLYLTLHFQNKFISFSRNNILWTVFFSSIYGILDELHQIPIPGRYFDLLDLLANEIGIFLGVYLTYKVFGKIKYKKQN